MLHELLALTLILHFTPQTTKKKKGTRTQPVTATKKTESDPAREAIKTLRTMSTVAEIGTTYSDYTTRLADVKIRVDELLTKISSDEAENVYNPKGDIEKALDSYVSAARYWQMMIKNKHPDLDASYKKLMDLAWEQARNYLDLATKGLDKKKK
jgi:hypothetical protein